MTTSFYYEVDSRYETDVRSSAEMSRLLQEGTDIAGTVSRYTGGPMIASIWTPKYVESGKPFEVSVSLTNNKEGTADGAIYCIYLDDKATMPYGTGGKFTTYAESTNNCPKLEGTKVVECQMGTVQSVSSYVREGTDAMRPLNSQSCNFLTSIDTGGAPQQQFVITGKVTYHYTIKYERKDIQIVG
jgi:hypothetical protein